MNSIDYLMKSVSEALIRSSGKLCFFYYKVMNIPLFLQEGRRFRIEQPWHLHF